MTRVFCVDLVSNTSREVYAENPLAALTNIINSPIDLSELYEVALNGIIYQSSFGDCRNIRCCYVSIDRKPSEDLKAAIKRVHEGSNFTFKSRGPMKIKEILHLLLKKRKKYLDSQIHEW